MLIPGAYQRGGLPRPFREKSSWDEAWRLDAFSAYPFRT